jgi:carbonic anhydrase
MKSTTPLPLLDNSLHRIPISAVGAMEGLLSEFGRGNGPVAMMICCADIGDAPEHLSRAQPGNLFVVQNCGNLVPNDGRDEGTVNAIDFALRKLVVHDLVVCGHLDCRIIGDYLLRSTTHDMSTLRSWLKHGERTRSLIESHYGDLPIEMQAKIAVQENVLVQLEHLMEYALIKERIQQEVLHVHGWLLDDHTHRVWRYDPETGQFDNF